MNEKNKKVAIIIPAYKKNISDDEKISIKHLIKYLNPYDKFITSPMSLNKVSFKLPNSKIINFPDEYFASTKTYSEMLNSKEFYRKFLNYQYILIYQLDTLVFSDQLIRWCNKGYDYLGAPFLNPLIGNLSYKKGSPVSGGNGGLSLRKVKSFIRVIEIAESLATRTSNNSTIRILWFLFAVLTNKSHQIWLNTPPKDYPFHEDGFWSYEAPKYLSKFKIAPFKESMKFSFERFPRKCFEINNKQIPFGCHAWAKYDRRFWSKYLLD